MKSLNFSTIFFLTIVFVALMIVWSTTTTQAGNASDLPIVQKWSGDFPVAHLDRLPQGKSKAGAGYIDDKSLFECLNNYYRFSDLYMGAK